ncbi:MAG: TIM-barrel domain-containing protein, partial [Verrucomicrobiia bacterium]
MKRSVHSLALACGVFGLTGLYAWAEAMPVTKVQKRSDGVALTMQSGTIRLQVWSDRVIRVTYAPTAELPVNKSLSVVGKPGKSKWKLREKPEAVTLETPALRARVDRKTGAVSFYDLNDKPIFQEAEGGREFAPSPVKEVGGTSVRQSFVLASGERIYGLGQHQGGIWNYRGTTVHLQQQNMEVAVPVLVSSKGYGVLWDNPAVTDVDVGVEGSVGVVRWTSETGKAVDYYFMFGPTADGVIRDYRELTGAAPMMGRWLWGFWQCKERYASQKELIDVVTEYRKRGVPIDG